MALSFHTTITSYLAMSFVDEASELKLSYSLTVSIAAIIIIVGIVIGPFLQQSVTFHSASAASIDTALLGFASAALTYTGTIGYVGSSYASYGTQLGLLL